ncbi:MAG TPA: BolA family protein [Xanthomonadaceae bacterium]|nr:BolA family protein [Xanthomonadaceae bacterium]
MSAAAIGDKGTRAERIRAALAALAPIEVELIDESHKHAGHAGARDGRGHFALRIVSGVFTGLGSVARHRKVYAVLGELMQTDIHALSIMALAPGESAQS